MPCKTNGGTFLECSILCKDFLVQPVFQRRSKPPVVTQYILALASKKENFEMHHGDDGLTASSAFVKCPPL